MPATDLEKINVLLAEMSELNRKYKADVKTFEKEFDTSLDAAKRRMYNAFEICYVEDHLISIFNRDVERAMGIFTKNVRGLCDVLSKALAAINLELDTISAKYDEL